MIFFMKDIQKVHCPTILDLNEYLNGRARIEASAKGKLAPIGASIEETGETPAPQRRGCEPKGSGRRKGLDTSESWG